MLRAREDKEEQVKKMLALSVLFILESLKRLNQFASLIVHFVAVLGIDKKSVWLCKREESLFIITGFLYYIRVMFVEYMLLLAT